MGLKSQMQKAVENPRKVPPYLLGKIFPKSRFGPWYQQSDRLVTWNKIDWSGLRDPPEHSAVTFYTYLMLAEMLEGEQYDRCLDLGCGFGYRTAWLSEFASDVYGIDPSRLAISEGAPYYPQIDFLAGAGQALPFPDDTFELLTTWVVLLHVPPMEIGDVAAEMKRVISDDGTLLLFEATAGEGDKGHVQDRSIEDYEDIFAPYNLVETANRGVPTLENENDRTLMKLVPT